MGVWICPDCGDGRCQDCITPRCDHDCQGLADIDPEVKMTDPASDLAKLTEASGDPEAFRVVYSALMASYESSCRVGHMTQFADEVAAIAVFALRGAGRLSPCATSNEVARPTESDQPPGVVAHLPAPLVRDN